MTSGARPSVFLDSNVLFSAAYRPGGEAIFELARRGFCRLCTSSYALEEAESNLRSKRPERLDEFKRLAGSLEIVPEPPPALLDQALALGMDPADAPILAAAVGRCDMLVTGDWRHFGRWMGKEALGVRIESLAGALGLLLEE